MSRFAVLLFATVAGSLSAQPTIGTEQPLVRRDGIERQLAPPRSRLATLSRDGRHLAFTMTASGQTRVDIVTTAPPFEKRSIMLGDTRGARVLTLQWTSPQRLVLATEDWAIATLSLADNSARIVLDPDKFSSRLADDFDRDNRDNPFRFDTYPRPPRLLRLVPGREDEVIVEGVQGLHLRNAIATTARLNLVTGEWTRLDDVRITEPRQHPWADAEGRYRLLEDRTTLPFSWRARGAAADGDLTGWKSLRSLLPRPLADAFSARHDTLWIDRAVPLGFSADSRLLYYATNLGRDTYGIRAWDFTAGAPAPDVEFDLEEVDLGPPVGDFSPRLLGLHERAQRRNNPAVYYTDFSPEPPASPLVFDRADGRLVGVRTPVLPAGTHWVDSDLADLQTALESDHPGRAVQIIDWDDTRENVLVNVGSPAATGRYFIYRRPDAAWVEMLRRDLIEHEDQRHVVETFTLRPASNDEAPLHGRVTLPRDPLGRNPPLVCYLPDGPWQQPDHGRSAPTQMLAEFGCVVLELEPHGGAGRGTTALLAGRDRPDVATAADLDRALAWLSRRHAFDPERIGLVGVGYGGWLALRIAELRSGRIRSVVSLNGFKDLDHLFTSPPPRERLEGTSRNLERAREVMAYFDAIKNDIDQTLAIIPEGDVVTDPDGNVVYDPADRQSFSTATRLQGFGEDEAEADSSSRFTTRLRVAEHMARAEEATPVSLPVQFASWFFGSNADSDPAYSVTKHIGDLQSAVFLCASPDRENRPVDDTRAIASALAGAKNPADLWILPAEAWSRPIAERPEVWLRVAAFLNETLIDFEVEIGTAREVKE